MNRLLSRIMDENHDKLLSFKELVQVIEILCKGEHSRKLMLLYCLHLPGVVAPGELDSPDNVDGTEMACDAAAFFDDDEEIDGASGGEGEGMERKGVMN